MCLVSIIHAGFILVRYTPPHRIQERIKEPRNMNVKNETIVFYHLPKTAGTTLDTIIRQNYRNSEVVTQSIDTHAFLAEFKEWPLAKRQQIRLLHGHFPFGIHDLLPQPTRYFAILRDPIERTISYYYHAKRDPHHYLYELINKDKMSLKTLIESGSALMMNDGQTRLLSAVFGNAPVGGISDEMLATAVSNLQQMTVVGLTEQFDATLILLQQAFGWQNIYYTRSNIGTNRQAATEIDQDTLATITNYNQQDLHLYHKAQALFKAQTSKQKPIFFIKLGLFHLQHKRHHFSFRYHLRKMLN